MSRRARSVALDDGDSGSTGARFAPHEPPEPEEYPGYADQRHRRQNAAGLGDQMGGTRVPEQQALDDGSAPNELIEGEGADLAARARGDAIEEEWGLAEIVAAKPIEEEAFIDSAARHGGEAERHEGDAERIGEQIDAARERGEHLPTWQQGSGADYAPAIASKAPIIGSESLILVIAYTFVPGTMRDHWLTAASLAVGIAIFTNVLGWILARAWDELPARLRGLFWAACGVTLASLFVWMVFEMGQFRAEAFSRLLNGDVQGMDPTFINQLQLLLAATAALSSMKFHMSLPGRRLQRLIGRLVREQAAAAGRAVAARRLAEAALRGASTAAADGAKAAAAIPYVDQKKEATVNSIDASTRFTRGLFATMFLRRRHEVPLDPRLVVALQHVRLRRTRDLVVLVLGSLAFVVALVGLVLGATAVTIVALAVTIGHAAVGLALHLRELRHERTNVATDPLLEELVVYRGTASGPNGKTHAQETH